ncbi:hypothetical protein ACX3U9_10845 [Corynebacterium pyruviciproducens]|uniref:hypothetical protein n=1 Tax=Corynebacterium TaxID=1716 RepID=UPI00191EDC0B|nr:MULTISPECIES: hypothetical protein [Corynebacterium]MDH4657205.1 hypothetical protein [Corynebacterium pyruviciproducens]MDK6566486.1 hypothetical protein [Corynebacterium pyruviciproducens]QQU87999.1 hypothetical protein I6I68_10410 [Corynebacterium glucuronolyticum]
MIVNDDQGKLEKEFEAWGKLVRKMSRIESKLRSQEIRSSAARRSCNRAIRNFWNTIYQIRDIEPTDLDQHPVSPYRLDPVTGKPRNLDDPEDHAFEDFGIVISNFEKREDKVRRLVQELTEIDKSGCPTPHDVP